MWNEAAVQPRPQEISGDNTRTPCIFPAWLLAFSLQPALIYELQNPMALTPQDVSRIAHLARLELADAESAALLPQLNDFFKIVEQMSAVNTSGVEPLYTPLSAVREVALRLREDAVTESNQRELNQQSAPAVEDGLFLVPKVIE